MKRLGCCRFCNLLSLVLVVFIFFDGCSSGIKTHSIMKEGESTLAVSGGNIWYKVSGSGKGQPLVLIHGGPGFSSLYLKAFEELGDERQVVRYDQLGSGLSDKVSDTALFTIERFVDELELLREHLGVEKWHLLGHSWGTVVALEYYRAYPEHVASLILGSMCIDADGWKKSTRKLLKTLPDSLQEAVLTAESTQDYADPKYQEAMNVFYDLYVWRKPVKEDLDSMYATFNVDLYNYMWGPSEFTATGTLKDYNGVSLLPQITVPVMFTVGEFDEIYPEMVKELSQKVPDSRYVMFEGAAHMTPWDAREESLRVVREFLQSVDTSR